MTFTLAQGFWQIKLGSVQLKGKSYKKNFQAVVDTGTSRRCLDGVNLTGCG